MDDPGTHFLNVDLDLKSREDLASLVGKLAKNVVVLHSRKERAFHHVSLELYETRYKRPERCIARFVELVEALPAPARRLWDGAVERRFDVGIQAGLAGATFATLIKGDTLRRLSELGGDIVFTVYPPTDRPRSKGR